ncbi:polymorphic toxin type 28 domain-containing protein [Vibrio neptunius]|uniref:polymorphic toxin type 28 domain-containing protein n=1 Tax=Vibrio neptunius TaxID=170651 RepID=UPI003314C43C
MTELRDAQRGLMKRIKSINKKLSSNKLDDASRSALEKELGEASRLLDKSEGYLPRK